MDINECYELLKYRATKSGFNGSISPNDFNLLWPRAEQRFFNKQYKQYGINQENESSLAPFKSDPIAITIASDGKYTKPNDMLHIDSIRAVFQGAETPIERVPDDRLANHLSSSYAAPTDEFPIYTEYATYLQFHPVDLGSAKLVYLKKLTKSKWGYTLNGNNRPVYDAATSVQPKWDDGEIDEIIYMVGADLGINMRDAEFQAFSERKIQNPV